MSKVKAIYNTNILNQMRVTSSPKSVDLCITDDVNGTPWISISAHIGVIVRMPLEFLHDAVDVWNGDPDQDARAYRTAYPLPPGVDSAAVIVPRAPAIKQPASSLAQPLPPARGFTTFAVKPPASASVTPIEWVIVTHGDGKTSSLYRGDHLVDTCESYEAARKLMTTMRKFDGEPTPYGYPSSVSEHGSKKP